MLSIRLTDETEKQLKQYCQHEGVTKSTVVKEALALYFTQRQKSTGAIEAGEGVFGQEGSTDGERSFTYKKRIKEKLNEKHAH
jgi:predicted DNA-binding protein